MKPKVHCHGNNSPQVLSILSQNNPAYVSAHPISWRTMLALSPHLSKWPLSLSFHHKTLCAHILPPYLPQAPPTTTTTTTRYYPSWFCHMQYTDHTAPNYTVSGRQLLPNTVRPKYLPQYLIFKHPQFMFLPQYETPSFIQYKTTDKIIVPYVLTFIYF